MRKLITSESVTEGHPDKLCDYISDIILDKYMEKDKKSRVACETMASKGKIYISAEITSNAKIKKENLEDIVRVAIKNIGYDNAKLDMDYKTCEVEINISEQSPDIAIGVDKDIIGAGDQGIVFGYACKETKEFMPLSIMLAHKLAKRLADVRKQKILQYLRPDGKVQVTVEYQQNYLMRIDSIVISAQHLENIDIEKIKQDIKQYVINYIIPKNLIDKNTKYYINSTGRFVIGGPLGDTGLTGRKIIVDTYGGYSKHGGGAFSGKDPTKVDRSGAYMARHIAKNIIANDLAEKCEIQIAYVIGEKKPVSLYVDTFGTSKIEERELELLIYKKFDLTPQGIINYLGLDEIKFSEITNYGHFGKENVKWEKVIKI